MRPVPRLLLLLMAVITIGTLLAAQSSLFAPKTVHAEDQPPEQEPERKTTLYVAYTLYEWWMNTWQDNGTICQLYVEHEGVPNASEVYYFCGQKIYNIWAATPPCDLVATGNANLCKGVYFHLVNTTPASRQVEVELAKPEITLSLEGCTPESPENICDELPFLRLEATEPLPNEMIVNIQGVVGNEPFECSGSVCSIPMHPTGVKGETIIFWANSSFGDSTEHYTALVRTVPWGDFMSAEDQATDPKRWYVDVISSQWRGSPPASCSETWQAFPDLGGPPEWLITPDDPTELASSVPYYYLAGALIKRGQVDISSCTDGGLEADGAATECGLEAAKSKVLEWQNQFDAQIVDVAKSSGVPATLMKNIFQRESQFWPGMFHDMKEAGLGQLTEDGADTVLLWNPDFFQQFCPLVYEQSLCQRGFGNLEPDQQAVLRGALVNKVNADCPECTAGIDLSQANFSVSVFAETLKGNCEQTGRIVRLATKLAPGEVSTYRDLWLMTLVNYNAGPGCLQNAVQAVLRANQKLTFENVAAMLEPVCQSSLEYITDITGVDTSLIEFQPTPARSLFTVTPGPSPTPRRSGVTITPGITATPDGNGYSNETPIPQDTPSGY